MGKGRGTDMLENDHLILRDFLQSDMEKRIDWEQSETEWQLWDAPWEYEGLTPEERREELEEYIRTMQGWAERCQSLSPDAMRYSFQIVIKEENRYIGWVNAYDIDDAYCYTEGEGHCTVGIDIPDREARGKGFGRQALTLFIDYLLMRGVKEIYTQTWSGNQRMIHIAEKMGFEECDRKKEIRMVRGERYDGLTFRLNKKRYEEYKGR